MKLSTLSVLVLVWEAPAAATLVKASMEVVQVQVQVPACPAMETSI
jgi:hypothetical protein